MIGEELYAMWSSVSPTWSRWAKPVLFAKLRPVWEAGAMPDWRGLDTSWAPPPQEKTALVVNLPGADSVRYGVALAARGYAPVPLYNTCPGMDELVHVEGIMNALIGLSIELRGMRLEADAPPAFLLDADRLAGGAKPLPRHFDNRWVVLPQDFPSANFLLSQGVRTAMLVQYLVSSPGDDLSHVLRRWQDAGIRVLMKDTASSGPPQELTVRRPWWFRTMFYRALVLAGLRRNSAGGFGGLVPEPSSGTGYG
ncbi:MAG: hypothetical protein V1873_02570 [Verrucomicrobiota bacterium]